MLQARALFDVTDGELDCGVLAVEEVYVGRRPGEVGEETMMTPAREQGLLGGIGQAGAAHDQPAAVVVTLGHLGDAVRGVGDGHPGIFSYGCYGLGDSSVPAAHGHILNSE